MEKTVIFLLFLAPALWRVHQKEIRTASGRPLPLDEIGGHVNGTKTESIDFPGTDSTEEIKISSSAANESFKSVDNTAVTITEQNNIEIENAERLTYTCRDRCRITAMSPCSCDATCVLYDMCCENITQDCPHVVTEGYALYTEYIGQPFVCDEGSSVFTLAMKNCSSEIDLPAFSDDEGEITLMQMKNKLLNAPVTDSITGLTYQNRVTYDCYKTKFNLSDELLHWAYSLEYLESSVNLQSIARTPLADVHDLYQPLFDFERLNPHLCSADVINSCYQANNLSLNFTYFSQKCLEFTSYVQSSLSKMLYRNRFCAYCYEGVHKKLNSVQIRQVNKQIFGFDVLFSMSDHGQFMIQIDQTTLIAESQRPSWSLAKCSSLQGVMATAAGFRTGPPDNVYSTTERNPQNVKENSLCEILECNAPYFTLHSDGLCKGVYHMLVAFKDNEEGLPPFQCSAAAHQIAQFVSCNLVNSLKNDRWDQVETFYAPTVSIGVHAMTNDTFYFVDISFLTTLNHIDNTRFALNSLDQVSNLHKLTTVVKAYQQYRQISDLCACPSQANRNKIIHVDPDDLIVNSDFTSENVYFGMENEMELFRGKVVDRKRTTTYCFSKIKPLGTKLDVSCIDDPLHADDMQQMVGVLNTPCLAHLQGKCSTYKQNKAWHQLQTLRQATLCLVAISTIGSFRCFDI